jgi:WD40 repeat protein
MHPWRIRPDVSVGGGVSNVGGSGHSSGVSGGASLVHSSTWSCFTQDASGGERSRRADVDEGGHGAVRALFFDGGGLLATADGCCVRLWSVERRKRICTLKTHSGKDELHNGGVSCISIEGGHLLSGGGDGARACSLASTRPLQP